MGAVIQVNLEEHWGIQLKFEDNDFEASASLSSEGARILAQHLLDLADENDKLYTELEKC